MDIVLSEAQEMLKRSAREFLKAECSSDLVRSMESDERGYPPQLWQRMVELGWLGLPFPQRYGGGGGSFFDLALLIEEMGYAAAPTPFLSSAVLSGFVLLEAGTVTQRRLLLPKVVSGELLLSLAYLEGEGDQGDVGVGKPTELRGDGFVLDGVKSFVPDVHISNYLLWLVRTRKGHSRSRGLSLFFVDPSDPAVQSRLMATTAGDKQFEVTVTQRVVSSDDVLGRLHSAGGPIQRVLLKATALKCAEMVGGAQAVLDMTVDYVKNRVQFGRPIGSFQAVHHHCADMYRELELGRLLAYQASWLLEQGMPSERAVSAAKLKLSRAYPLITRLAHQVTGAVGYYTEYPLELYTRRALAAAVSFGGIDYHANRLADDLW